jgi:hypothetical protein
MTERKKTRRYKETTRSGITIKTYVPSKNHQKLGEVCKIYTREEVEALAKKMGFSVSTNKK